MSSSPTNEELSIVLDKLQRVYRFRLDPLLLPSNFRDGFYKAAKRFCREDFNEKKMGIAEEVGDITYQLLKMIAVRWKLLTPENQRVVSDKHIDKIGTAQFSLKKVYDDAYRAVSEDSVMFFSQTLPERAFPDPAAFTRFFANQYVSYISRSLILPRNASWAYHTEDYIKSTKIPEETAELISVLNKFPDAKYRKNLLGDIEKNIRLSEKILALVKGVVSDNAPTNELLLCLDDIVRQKLGKNTCLGEVLDFCLFKIRGRQELTFNGYAPREVMHICKPAEYLIEADLFL